MRCLTELQAGACWAGSYPAVLHDTSCASKKPGWRSRHAAAPGVLPTLRLLTSLGRFVASLRPIAAVSLFAWVTHQGWPARMCPSIPSWTLPDVPTKDIILTHPNSVQTVVTRRLRRWTISCDAQSTLLFVELIATLACLVGPRGVRSIVRSCFSPNTNS